jgi:hypothetical protein
VTGDSGRTELDDAARRAAAALSAFGPLTTRLTIDDDLSAFRRILERQVPR